MRSNNVNLKQTFFIFWIILFTFEDFLSQIFAPFSYIDEAPLFLFILLWLIKTLKSRKIRLPKQENRGYVGALIIFTLTGLIGNLVYHYQPIDLMIVDLLTNLKFFGAIAFFSMWVNDGTLNTRAIPKTAKILSVLLFILFLVDRVLNIWPAEVRYGIKSAQLFYNHPTYLAGVCAFLIALMAMYNTKKYKIYILIDIVILLFTLRSKAIVSALLFSMLFVLIKQLHGKLKRWQIVVVALIGVACGWSQIYFYFIRLSGASARSVMLLTSFIIMKDYFPMGTGFGTYASHSAAEIYSPVYTKYGFESIYELRNSSVGTFFDDQFWPIIFGQTGVIGTICYIYILWNLFRNIQKLFKIDQDCYLSALFVLVYLLISSVAEPAFNNSVAIPLAMIIASAVTSANNYKFDSKHICELPQ